MIKNKLNVGDYVFNSGGGLYRITKVNNITYSAKSTKWSWETKQVPFNGITKYEEYFECDEPQAKALELAIKTYDRDNRIIKEVREAKELIGKVKYLLWYVKDFLEDIKDIEEIEPEADFR